MSKLHNLFGKFKSEDLAYDVYRSFYHEYKTKGLVLPFLVSELYYQIKKEYEQLPLSILLNLLTGGKVMSQIQESQEGPKDVLEKITMRDAQCHYFILLSEDEVEVSIGRGDEVIINTRGLVKDLKIDTTAIKNRKYAEGTMAVMQIKLIAPSSKRTEEESRAFYGRYQDLLAHYASPEYQLPFLKAITDEGLKNKRLELYGATTEEEIGPQSFGTENALKIQKILKNIKSPYESNESLLTLEPTVETKELEKMKAWLKRDLGLLD